MARRRATRKYETLFEFVNDYNATLINGAINLPAGSFRGELANQMEREGHADSKHLEGLPRDKGSLYDALIALAIRSNKEQPVWLNNNVPFTLRSIKDTLFYHHTIMVLGYPFDAPADASEPDSAGHVPLHETHKFFCLSCYVGMNSATAMLQHTYSDKHWEARFKFNNVVDNENRTRPGSHHLRMHYRYEPYAPEP